jgi:hypothetical protein
MTAESLDPVGAVNKKTSRGSDLPREEFKPNEI